MIDTADMEVKPPRRPAAIVREITPPARNVFCEEPIVWLTFQAAPNLDGETWCIRQRSACGRITNSYGHFNSRLLAVNLAAEENAKLDAAKGDA